MADPKEEYDEVVKSNLRAKQQLEKTREEQKALSRQNAELMSATKAMSEQQAQASEKVRQLEKRFASMRANLKGRPLKVELPGGAAAQVSNALMNWGVESLGKKFPWVDQYADWLLGLPTTISLLAYVALAANRKETSNWTRDFSEEALKISAHLGIKDAITALRKGRQKRVEQTKAAQDRVTTLEAQNAQLMEQINALAAKQGKP